MYAQVNDGSFSRIVKNLTSILTHANPALLILLDSGNRLSDIVHIVEAREFKW